MVYRFGGILKPSGNLLARGAYDRLGVLATSSIISEVSGSLFFLPFYPEAHRAI